MKTPPYNTLCNALRESSTMKMTSAFSRKPSPRSAVHLVRCLAAMSGIAALALGLDACGTARPIKYYQVNYPTKSVVSDDALRVTLMVRPIEASHLYLDDKIVYGFDTPEMGTYEYQRWSEPPVEVLQLALVRGLRSTGRFRAVYTLRADPNERFILSGYLYDFKEVDTNPMVARLNFEVRLRDRTTGAVVWDYTYTHDEPAASKTVMAFVEAMDKNVQRSVQEVQAGLVEYFRAHPPE
jgi:ABC-type uncharacterized transport system auxiliary subunit